MKTFDDPLVAAKQAYKPTPLSSLSSSSPPPFSCSLSSKKNTSVNTSKTVSTPLCVRSNHSKNSNSRSPLPTESKCNEKPHPAEWSHIAASSIDEITCRPILHTSTTKLRLDSKSNRRVSVYRVNSVVGCAIKFLTETVFDIKPTGNESGRLQKVSPVADDTLSFMEINKETVKRPKKKSLRIFTDSSFLMITNSSSSSSFAFNQAKNNTDSNNTTPSPPAKYIENDSSLITNRQLDARETVKSIYNLSSPLNNQTLNRKQKKFNRNNESTKNRFIEATIDQQNNQIFICEIADVATSSDPNPIVQRNSLIISRSSSSKCSNTSSMRRIPFIDDKEDSTVEKLLLNGNTNHPDQEIAYVINTSQTIQPQEIQIQETDFDKIELIDLLHTSELNMNKKLNEYVDLITLSSTSTSNSNQSSSIKVVDDSNNQRYMLDSTNYFQDLNNLTHTNNNFNNRSLSLNVLNNNYRSNSNRTTMSASPTALINRMNRRRQQQDEQHQQHYHYIDNQSQLNFIQRNSNYHSDQYYDDYDYEYDYDYNNQTNEQNLNNEIFDRFNKNFVNSNNLNHDEVNLLKPQQNAIHYISIQLSNTHR